MGSKLTGFDQLTKKLKQIEKNAKELNKQKHVSFAELFTSSFMRKYTSFSSMDELFEAGGFKVSSLEDFKAIPDAEFDNHIKSTTSFANWEAMQKEAASQYAIKKLGF